VEEARFIGLPMMIQLCNLLNWNVRGLNNRARRGVVSNLVRDTRATIVSLQETKLATIDAQVVRETLGDRFVANFIYLPAVGTCGGILLAVDEEFYSIARWELGVHSVTAMLTTASGDNWCITVVYEPQEDQAKLQFLGEIRWLQHCVTDKWLIIGDFNMILQAADKSNDNINRRLMDAFRAVVDDLELKELPLRGRRFTWSNNQTQTRIDRAFCSSSWDLMMPNVCLHALSSRVSDHCPLFIVGQATVRKFKGFRFEVFWPKLPGFLQVVQEAWAGDPNVFNPFLSLHVKLQRTSKALRQWARRLVGNNKVLLCATAKLIGIIDVVQEFRPLSEREIRLRRDLKARFLGLTAVEKIRAKQCSRLTAIRAAEANQKLFFLHANGRRRKKIISSLNGASGILFTQEEMEEEVFNHFQAHFGRPAARALTLNWEEINFQGGILFIWRNHLPKRRYWLSLRTLPATKPRDLMATLVFFSRSVGGSSKLMLCRHSSFFSTSMINTSTT
jgi:exonuclease III